MKKVLVYGMTENPGGIESYLMNYYKRISPDRIHFDFVTCDKKIAYEKEIKSHGGKIFFIPERRENLLKHMKGLRKIAENGYDAVYFNLLSASEFFSVIAVKGLRKVEIIVHSHNNYVKTIKRHLVLRQFLNLVVDKRLACSEEAARFMFGRYGRDTIVIKNAIEVDRYLYNPVIRGKIRDENNIGGSFLVGHVGRLCYQKNTLFLLDIFNEVYKKYPDSKLVIIGEGEDHQKIQERIIELSLQECVIMTGAIANVNEWMQAMDVFLLPSRFEGLPVVAIEAQAAGLPCICSDKFSKASAITKNVEFLSLELSKEEWANCILDHKNDSRENTYQELTESGYNIENEVETFYDVFCK